MPRPRRTRASATRQTKQGSEPTVAPAAQLPAADANFASDLSNDIYGLSDREKEKTRARKSRAGAPGNSTTVPKTTRTRAGTRASVRQSKAPELEGEEEERDVQQGGDDAATRLGDITYATKTLGVSSDDIESPPEVGRRSHTTSSRPSRPTDVSGLDLDDDIFGDLDDSLADGGSGGQHSTDTSSLSISAFRKRPRKSSIVGRDDAPIRPSSRGLNTPGFSSNFSFGQFRRRQREPSILGSRRNRSHSRQPYASGDESTNERDLTRLFDPTPLRNASRQRRGVAPPSSEAAASRQPSPELHTRKRKSLEEHSEGSRKRAAVESNEDQEDQDLVQESDQDDVAATPPRGRSPPRQEVAAFDSNDPDMAPPLSSGSSAGSPGVWPSLSSLGHRTYRTKKPAAARAYKTPEPGGDVSDVSSPPSLTHSPNFQPAAAARRRRQPQQTRPAKEKVTTADLASLLPQRRHKIKATTAVSAGRFALESSSSDAEHEGSSAGEGDDDELSYSASRRTARAKRRGAAARQPKNHAKGKQAAADAGKRPRRTYGSHGSDKENQEEQEAVDAGGADGAEAEEEEETVLDEETSQMMVAKMGEELKKAAKKFKEVDRWELEFEEVVESSSPSGGR